MKNKPKYSGKRPIHCHGKNGKVNLKGIEVGKQDLKLFAKKKICLFE